MLRDWYIDFDFGIMAHASTIHSTSSYAGHEEACFGNGNVPNISYIGNFFRDLKLSNVLVVPDITKNIL